MREAEREEAVLILFYKCNRENISVVSAMKQIKQKCYKCNEANSSVTSAIKQKLGLRVQLSIKFTIKFTMQ